jgi:hypothetical protein
LHLRAENAVWLKGRMLSGFFKLEHAQVEKKRLKMLLPGGQCPSGQE